MMIFLGVLTIGFIYEWKKGALEWEYNNNVFDNRERKKYLRSLKI